MQAAVLALQRSCAAFAYCTVLHSAHIYITHIYAIKHRPQITVTWSRTHYNEMCSAHIAVHYDNSYLPVHVHTVVQGQGLLHA
jgi:hypothetical protein